MKQISSKILFTLLCVLFLTGCSQDEQKGKVVEEEFAIEVPEEYIAAKHPVADSFAGGDGTEENPYQIANAEQLAYWAETIHNWDADWKQSDKFSESFFILTDDIVFNDLTDFDNWSNQAPDYRWDGVMGYHNNGFWGGFDGNGHSISGLYMIVTGNEEQEYANSCAFIDYLGDGYVRNLTIEKSYYRCLEGAYGSAGIIGELNGGTVENCVSSVTIDYAGEISKVAGVVRESFKGNILNCTFKGTINSEDTWSLSGVVGNVCGGKVIGCTNYGVLNCAESVKYGIAGEISSEPVSIITSEVLTEDTITLIRDCANYSDINGGCGLFGAIRSGQGEVLVENCVNYDKVSEGAGIVGQLRSYVSSVGNPDRIPGKVVFKNCVNKGVIESENDAAGCVGLVYFSSNMEIVSCVNEGAVYGGKNAGGVIGTVMASQVDECANSKLFITDCINYGEVNGTESGVGGIVSNVDFYSENEEIGQSISISNNENQGSVTGSGYGVAGVLGAVMGMHGGVGDEVVLDANTNTGEVQGILPFTSVGGIVGYYPKENQKQAILDCVNTGVVSLIEGEDSDLKVDNKVYYGIVGEIAGAVQEGVILDGNRFTGKIEMPNKFQNHILTDKEVALYMPIGSDVLFVK